MASIYKKKGRRSYIIAYFDHTGKRHERSARTTDYKAASRIAAKPEADDAQRRLIEEKRAECEARSRQQDAFAKSSYPEGAQLCSKCNTAARVMMDGCMTCLSCGDSRCG